MAERVPDVLERYPQWEAVIGIETHIQLKTETKLFCGCITQFGAEPNTQICPVCAGYPGVLPVLNKTAVEYAVMAGLAINAQISPVSEFARKHYMYPDLPKNYQITQGDVAICMHGSLATETKEGENKSVTIQRIHIEEDAGKTLHMPHSKSFVDLNRAGTPLLEIVTAPDIANAHEAKYYLMHLRLTMLYLGISDVSMEEGSFRADINISVRKKGTTQLGTRTEVKNVNSFKFIAQAINYEVERQIMQLEAGHPIEQETRLWNEKEQKTIRMRVKSDADDYRYFTEPDLPPIHITEAWYKELSARMPELPHTKKQRFMQVYGLSDYDADLLIQEKTLADYFEAAVACYHDPKGIVNWISRDLLGYLKAQKISLSDCPLTPAMLADLVKAIGNGTISTKMGQEVFLLMAESGASVDAIIAEKGLSQIGDEHVLSQLCRDIIAHHPDIVLQYKAGNTKLFGFLVGQVMKQTKGQGNPKMINTLLTDLLQQ